MSEAGEKTPAEKTLRARVVLDLAFARQQWREFLAEMSRDVDAVLSSSRSIHLKLDKIIHQQEKLMGLAEDQAAALKKIDDATTQTAGNVQAISDISTTIASEVTALVGQLQVGQPVTQEMVDAANALGTKAQAVSDASSALIPVLQGIASQGANNPVPVAVPPAPENPPTT
jgi:methyl-accepting chemotaxis protein